MTNETTVGRFTFHADGTISGPADYMRGEGLARIERINAGVDEAYERIARNCATFEQALLLTLQTDYAAFAGRRAFFKTYTR